MALQDHSAPGTSAAFSFQFERALHWLSKSPSGFMVGIETDDDVAVKGVSGVAEVLEQDKHSTLPNAKPFGDRSKDLWNTLATWVSAVAEGEISGQSAAFLMVTNKVLPDCLAKQIAAARATLEIDLCIAKLEEASRSSSPAIAKLSAVVLDASSRTSLREVILNAELIDGGKAAGGEALRNSTLSNLQIPEWCGSNKDSIANELLGWMHRNALSTWQEHRPFWISRDHFVNQLHAILDRKRRRMTRERAEDLIPVADSSVGSQKGRPFVKQLHLVTDDNALVDTAIREYIRCGIEKSRLCSEGNVTDADWISFERTLVARWEKIKSRVSRVSKHNSERDIGFEIFTDTTEEHREMLAGNETEQVYLTSGTYHRLADASQIGWHPRFSELIAKDTV